MHDGPHQEIGSTRSPRGEPSLLDVLGTTIAAIGAAAVEVRTADAVLTNACESLVGSAAADAACIIRLEPTGEARLVAAAGDGPLDPSRASAALTSPQLRVAIEGQRTTRLELPPLEADDRPVTLHIIPIPGTAEGSTALCVSGDVPDPLAEDLRTVLESVALQISHALKGIDILTSEGRAAEAAEHASSERAALLAHARDVIAIVEKGGKVRWISDNVERLTGYPPEFYLGGASPGVHQEDVVRLLGGSSEQLRQSDDQPLYALRLAHRSGGWRWCEVHVSDQLHDPFLHGFVISFHDITDQKAAIEEAAFRAELLASVGQAVVASDAKGRVTYMNPAALAHVGLSLEEALGKDVNELLPYDGMEETIPDVRDRMIAHQVWQGELSYRRPDGSTVPMLVTNTPIVHDETVVGVIGVGTDITEKVRVRRRLQARERRQSELARLSTLALGRDGPGATLQAVAQCLGESLQLDLVNIVEGVDGGVLVSATWGHGPVEAGDVIGSSSPLQLAAYDLTVGRPLVIENVPEDPRFQEFVETHGQGVDSAILAVTAGPSRVFGVIGGFTTSPRHYDDDEISFVQSLANIVAATLDRAEAEAELNRVSLYDELTRLPNRSLFRDRVEQAVAQSRDSNRHVGVVLIDLDRFKEVNDAFGHEIGDQLLVAVADRLRQAITPDQTLARFGGDEFAVLHPAAVSIEDMRVLAYELHAALSTPIRIGRVELFAETSMGISLRTGPSSAATLLREADAAMYRAKDAGSGSVEVYGEHMRERAVRRVVTATDLRHALERGELRVHWQAEVPLRPGPGSTGELWAEALVRWEHPTRGLLGPGDFVELAEETGLIVPLGRQVLELACRQLAAWNELAGAVPRRASVNLSPRQLSDRDLIHVLAETMETYGISPQQLTLEITETAVMTRPDEAIRRLQELRDLGISLAVDDFGTGYSSLGYLRQLPVSILKIDKSFVDPVVGDTTGQAIVRGVIDLGHALGLEVVAEGIETPAQRTVLTRLGCDRGQGYLWSRPLPADELLRALRSEADPVTTTARSSR